MNTRAAKTNRQETSCAEELASQKKLVAGRLDPNGELTIRCHLGWGCPSMQLSLGCCTKG